MFYFTIFVIHFREEKIIDKRAFNMPTGCAVGLCKSIANKDTNCHFFCFPKDKSLRKLWITRCFRKNKFNSETSRVCSNHFQDSDYENLMEFNLMGTRLRLKKDAVPSKNLKPVIELTLSENTRQIRYQNKQNQLHISKLIEQNVDVDAVTANENSLMEIAESAIEKTPDLDVSKLQENNLALLKEIDELKKQYTLKCDAYSELHLRFDENKKDLEASLRKIKHLENKNITVKKSLIESEAKTILSKIFTENQISLLLGKQKKVHWSEKDITLAFTLRYYSKRCYIFLREKLHYPLPGKFCLLFRKVIT